MSEEEKKNNIKEYQKQYQNSYQKANTKKVGLILNKKTDAELIAFLETKNNKAGYIKELIYKDMQETISKKMNG